MLYWWAIQDKFAPNGNLEKDLLYFHKATNNVTVCTFDGYAEGPSLPHDIMPSLYTAQLGCVTHKRRSPIGRTFTFFLMIVFNLACSQDHHFDGWFRSSDDFERQLHQEMIACPVCGDSSITKQLSAPRLNVGATAPMQPSQPSTPPATSNAPQEVVAASMLPNLQSHMLRQFKQFVVANTENVGNNFAETARRMHYGEESHRNIRGRVSSDESQALREEGIETVGLPPGIFLDEGVQ